MKDSLYQWVKTLAIFYILFSMVIHLIPEQKYERYIKSFMGMFLIYILCTPVFSLLGKGEEMISGFSLNYQEELELMESEEAENLQSLYLRQGYCRELKTEITKICMQEGVNPTEVIVQMDGDKVMINISTYRKLTAEQERGIRNELAGNYGIEEENIRILSEGNEQAAVDRNPASWITSYDSSDADDREKSKC